MDSLHDRWWDEPSGVRDKAMESLAGPLPNSDYALQNEKGPSMTLLSIGGKSIAVAISIWLFAYISAAFPYLGTYSFNFNGGIHSETSVGLRHMLLFEGQTAFIDYQVKSSEGVAGEVTFDITPWPALKGSPHRKRVSGQVNGTSSYVVPETGIYTFYHNRGMMAGSNDIYYEISWGAR